MTSTDKKSYQYYFKKPQTPVSSKQLRRPQHLRTQPYLKYEKYEKLKSSSIIPSSNKSIKYERVSQPCELQKRGGLYSSGYTPGKYGLNRQYYKSGDTEKKYTPKYIAPYNTSLNITPIKQVNQQQRVKQFNANEQTLNNQIQQNQQLYQQKYKTTENNNYRQMSSLQKNHSNKAKHTVLQDKNEEIKQFQSVDLRQKNVQLSNFINSTMGKSVISWNDQELVESKYQKQKQLKSSLNKYEAKQDYFSQIQRFRQRLKQQEMKISTMFTIQQKQLVNDKQGNQQKQKMKGVSHVESKTFLHESNIIGNDKKYIIECKQCQLLGMKLNESKKQVQDLNSKMKQTMQQVKKQYNTLKEYQQNESQLKQQIETKNNQLQTIKIKVSELQELLRVKNQQSKKQQEQLQRIKQTEIDKITQKYQQLLNKQKQTVVNYLSCITQLNKKIQQLDQQQQQTIKELTDKYQQHLKKLIENHQKQLQNGRQSIERQSIKIKQHFENEMNLLKSIHYSQTKIIKQNNQQLINKMRLQLSDTNSYKQQVQYLTQVVVKLQSQILYEKTVHMNTNKQTQQIKNTFKQLQEQIKIKQNQLDQSEQNIIKLNKQIKQNKQIYQKTLQEMSIKINQKQQLIQSFLNNNIKPNQKQIKTNQKNISPNKINISPNKINISPNKNQSNQLPQEQWSSISPSTSSLSNKIKFSTKKQNKIIQKDQTLAKSSIQIKSLEQKINSLEKTLQQKDILINQNQQIIIELNDKIISLQKKLYPSDQLIPIDGEQQKQPNSIQQNKKDHNSIQLLNQQLQNKGSQITQLQHQLHESLDIIKLLKNQLTAKEHHIMKIFTSSTNQHQTINDDRSLNQPQQKNILSPKKLTIQLHQQDQQNYQQQKQNYKRNKKQIILKQYFIKIQDFYNQLLQIFGLDLIHHQTLQLNNIPSPLSTPRKKNPNLQKLFNKEDSIKESNEQKSNKQTDNYFTSFQQQTMQEHTQQITQNQPINHLPLPEPKPLQKLPTPNPLQQTLQYLSYNQQQVLRIINQWIRKLQRQSSSIHQLKQKNQFLQQQIAHLSQDNNLLSLEKLQIYDKYEAFVNKLEDQNNHLQEKCHIFGQKIMELQNYIKELQEAINETNKECLQKGLMSLELHKEHSIFGKLIYNSLFKFQKQHNSFQVQQKQNYIEEFYLKWSLQENINQKEPQVKVKQQKQIINESNQQYIQQKNVINLTKSEVNQKQTDNRKPQNQQDQVLFKKTQPKQENIQTVSQDSKQFTIL